jgi:hypothetical protein
MLRPKLPQTSFFISGNSLYDRIVPSDHLSGTNVLTDTLGNEYSKISYYPYGDCRNSTGSLETDKLFTGQSGWTAPASTTTTHATTTPRWEGFSDKTQ